MVYLHALGIDGNLDSFSNRKRIQKMVYLLRRFGADLKFGYSWYLHGPYSPALTRVLFDTEGESDQTRELSREEFQIINGVRNFLVEDLYSVNTLELIVSLLYLIRYGPREGYDTKGKIVKFMKEQKPYFTAEEIESAWNKIGKSNRWVSDLAKIRQ